MRLGCAESASIRMPDTSHQRERVEDFVRNASSAPTSGGSKGGVMQNRNCKSCTVEIRPSKWNEKNKPCKFWIGKLSYGWAQYKADTIFHYTGKPRFHFKDVDLIFPDLECIGTEINTRVLLTTMEMRFKYVQSIAGEGFAVQRQDFRQKVENVMDSADFIRQGKRLLNSREEAAVPSEDAAGRIEETAALREAAAGAVEEAVIPGDEAATFMQETATFKEETATFKEETATFKEETAIPAEEAFSNEGDDRAEESPPIEEDSISLQAIRQSQLFLAPLSSDVSRVYPTPVLRVAGSVTDLVCGLEFSQAYAPSFEINLDSSRKSLQSVGQSFGSTCFTLDDCPTNCGKDKEKHRSWMETIAELNTNAYRSREVLSSDAPELESNFDSIACQIWVEDLGSDVLELDPSFVSTTGYMIADAEQLNNAKRQKIGD